MVNYRQKQKDEVADALQRVGLPREEVKKILDLIEAVLAHGDTAGTIAESLTKQATLDKGKKHKE